MSENTPLVPHETHDELVAGKGAASHRPNRFRRARWIATALGLASTLVLGAGVAWAEAEADESPADPGAVRALERDMAGLFDKLGADLDARLEAQTDAIVKQVVEEQVAATRYETARNIVMAQEVAHRESERLAGHGEETPDLEREADTPVKIASGSLALQQQASPGDEEERVERGRHRFEEKFVSPPSVAVGMRLLDRPEPPRVAIRVVNVDRTGFDYEVRTWGDSPVADLTADWVAYAGGTSTAPPAAPR